MNMPTKITKNIFYINEKILKFKFMLDFLVLFYININFKIINFKNFKL